MKWICLLLLAANIAYFGWTLDQSTRETVQARSSALKVPRNVPRLTLLSELEQPPVRRMTTEAGKPVSSVDDKGDDSGGEPELVKTLPDISGSLPESLIKPMELKADACFSFGPFADPDRAARLRNWLQAHDSEVRLRQEPVADKQAADGREQLSWVYLAPQPGAEKTLEELRRQGVRDVSLIDTGNLQNAISLGLFSSQASVNRRLRELQDKGYQPVVIPYSESRTVEWVDASIERSDTIDALKRVFRNGLNYTQVECDKIALTSANP